METEEKTTPDTKEEDVKDPITDGGEEGDTKEVDTKEDESEEEDIDIEKIEPEVKEVEEEEDSDDEDDDEMDEEDRAKIDKQINKRLNPIKQGLQAQKDELELKNFLAENKEFEKYGPAIKKYQAHPTYKNIPVANIALIVAGKVGLMRIGAQRDREAQRRADSTKSMGNNGKGVDSAIKVEDMTKEQFEEHIARIKGERS